MTKKKEAGKAKPGKPEKGKAEAEYKLGAKAGAKKKHKISVKTPLKDGEKGKRKKVSKKPAVHGGGKADGKKLIQSKAAAGIKQTTKKVNARKTTKTIAKIAKESLTPRIVESNEPVRGNGIKFKGRMKAREKDYRVSGENKQPADEMLPSEYGETGITLMPVDPYKLFVFWEVRKDVVETREGDLTIRVYDVAEKEFEGVRQSSYCEITVGERVGKRYIDVCPAKHFIADIGIASEGVFVAFAKSLKVSTPRSSVEARSGLEENFSEGDLRIGY